MYYAKILSIIAVMAISGAVSVANTDVVLDKQTAADIGSAFSQTDLLDKFHNPTPWLEMGADFRYRIVYDEARKLDKHATGHDRINQRFRLRWWSKFKLFDDLDFNMRLVTEPRYYHRPDYTTDKQFQRQEALFDTFNLTWRNVFNLPMTATVGRQDISLGSRWLLLDGTPLDGGRTKFFDALRLTYDLKERDTTADFIWIENHGDSAKWLKPINDRDIDLIEQDERGVVFYVSNKSLTDTQLDGYFIYKRDYNRNRSTGSEGDIYTFGTMVKRDINERWKYMLEFAPQFGQKNGKELGAFATNNQLTYHFNDEKKNSAHIGFEYLSGDEDPDKNFDRLWGCSDEQWSKLYQGPIDAIDGKECASSNLYRLYLGWTTEPTEKLKAQTTYNLIFANKNPTAPTTYGLSEDGKFRGQLLKTELDYKVSKNLSHKLEFEFFLPGDFYTDARNDVAVFLRYGILLTW